MSGATFRGTLYSYIDARRRAPAAWEITAIPLTYSTDAGRPAAREDVRDVAPKGLGHFERHAGGRGWVYVGPNGYARKVNEAYGEPAPPPLPRPSGGRKQARCSCGPHTCGSCGQPHWIEVHGYCTGYCTYCYHAG